MGRSSRGTVKTYCRCGTGENVLIDPLAIQEHALLVATGLEIARLAGEGE